MTLIKSISGIRGTIGGHAGEGLNPLDITRFTAAYATLIRKTTTKTSNLIVVGRDARISGEMVRSCVCGTLMGMGFDVLDIGMASTPTTELAVTMSGACGGIILTASHNPRQWNALKLLNEKGEFLNAAEGQEVLRIAAAEEFTFAEVDEVGKYTKDESFGQRHIDAVLALELVDVGPSARHTSRWPLTPSTPSAASYSRRCSNSWAWRASRRCMRSLRATSSIIPSRWRRTSATS